MSRGGNSMFSNKFGKLFEFSEVKLVSLEILFGAFNMLMCAVTLPGTCDMLYFSYFLDQYLVCQLPAGHQCSGAYFGKCNLRSAAFYFHLVCLVNPNKVKLNN